MTMKITKQKDDEESPDRHFAAVKIDLPGVGIRPVTSLVLRPDTEDPRQEIALSKTQVNEILDEVARAWETGSPWSNKVQTKRDGRWLPKWINTTYGVSLKQAESYVEDLLFNGFLSIGVRDTDSKMKGLKVLKKHL
jgi:hypothetical protein